MSESSQDRIIIEGMQFYAYHGRNPEERVLGQPFIVDIETDVDLNAAGTSDNICDTVSYSDLYRAVKTEMEGASKNLLEAVAHSIAQQILNSFPVRGIKVRIKKTRPPIKDGILSSVGVEVYRTRA